jgi:hypothetical protein
VSEELAAGGVEVTMLTLPLLISRDICDPDLFKDDVEFIGLPVIGEVDDANAGAGGMELGCAFLSVMVMKRLPCALRTSTRYCPSAAA